MLPRDEMFLHMEEHHVKFYSHMCGPARPYQCSVCRRTMETEKQHAGHRYFFTKVEKILKGTLVSIPSPSPSVKIQTIGRKVCLRCKGKTLLGIVNKLLKTKK